jgi:integrase
MKFSAAEIARLRQPGRYGDGRGLVLDVITKDRRNWIFRYRRSGKERVMGLGSAADVSLAEAREKALAARKLLADGIDPIDHRRAERQANEAQAAACVTFTDAAEAYIAAHEPSWRNAKHRQQWRSTLGRYAGPKIGSLPVGEIAVNHVLGVLAPIWVAMPATASRLRSRIELVLDYAIARGWRSGPNPAVWRGGLKPLLPSPFKVRAVTHHAALDWREAPAFLAQLRRQDSMGARALAFAILTAARSGEARGARWSEINMAGTVWTIPAARMKAGKAHRVPLSEPTLVLLAEMAAVRDASGLVFIGQRYGVPLTATTLVATLRRMGLDDLTVHGFRSTFRSWCADTGQPADLAEAALAHAPQSAIVAAYQRSDLLEARRGLMEAWAAFLARPPADVVPLHRVGATG